MTPTPHVGPRHAAQRRGLYSRYPAGSACFRMSVQIYAGRCRGAGGMQAECAYARLPFPSAEVEFDILLQSTLKNDSFPLPHRAS